MTYTNNKYIVLTGIVWLFITLTDAGGILFLDDQFFAFRAWEVMINNGAGGPFKPNAVFEKRIHGDLSNMLKIGKFRRFRHQKFSTDPYGYRNPYNQADIRYPIVVIGDSDMAGSSLSDDDIFSVRLSSLLKTPVYNYSPALPVEFLADRRFKESPPRILIWEAIERTISGSAYSIYSSIPVNANIVLPKKQSAPQAKKKSPRLSEHYAKWLYQDARWRITGMFNEAVGYIDEQPGMLFYQPALDMLKKNPSERGMNDIINGIERIKDILEKRNIILIYMPLPDKENIYSRLLPENKRPGYSEKNSFLTDLHKALDQRGIYNINLYEAFCSEMKNQLLYFSDDTHWNAQGVSVSVREAGKIVKKVEDEIISQKMQTAF